MAGDPVRSSESLLDLNFQSLAAQELNMKQMELDSATAKLDELRRELEKRRADSSPVKTMSTELFPPQNFNPTLSPSLTRRNATSTAPSVPVTSSLQSSWPRPQEPSLSSSINNSLTVNSGHTIPTLSISTSPNMTGRSLPPENLSVPSRTSWGRPSSPRVQYYERPVPSPTARLSTGSYDYNMGTRPISPVPEGPTSMPVYLERPQRPSPAYESPQGFAPPRYSDDISSLRRRPPQRSWNESDLDMVYEKKAPQDRAERSSLGGVPVMKAWRESSLDPAPMKSKGDTSFTLPRGYKFSSMDRVPAGMDRVLPGMDRIPPGMDRIPPGMDRVPPGMDRVPPGMDRVPPGMDRVPQGMDRFSQGMDRYPPGTDSVWKSGTGSLPRSLPPQQPISRIPVPPPGGRGQPHRPLPLSMIFQLQNAFWQHHQIPPQNYATPSSLSIPAAPPPSIPVIPELPIPSAAAPVPPPAIEEVPRPLSPTRLQPHLPESYADVQRVLEDIPRPLRRRGSQEHTSQGPPLPTDRRQYRQIMNRLFGKAPPKSSAPEQPKAEEKLQGTSVRVGPIQEELVVEDPNFFKLVPIPEEPRPEEKPEATLPKPEEPVTIILEASESRVGASALVPGEGEQGVPLVITQSQTPELRSALKGRNSPRKSHPRRARLDPLILLLDGALSGELDVVNQALQEVNDPSQPNEEGITALHNAICGANYHIVNLLISSGANVNAADSHGWTPLHCAASCNDLQICSMLVRHGAAIFATTYSDGSLAVEKCDPYREGYKECLTYLTEVEQCMGETQSGVVYALWDYTAEFADELSVREGDSVTVLRKDGEGGTWWWAALCGREGYIPRNYFGMYPRIRPQRSPL